MKSSTLNGDDEGESETKSTVSSNSIPVTAPDSTPRIVEHFSIDLKDVENNDADKQNRADWIYNLRKASFLSRSTFSWLSHLIKYALKNEMILDDLPLLREENDSTLTSKAVYALWHSAVDKCRRDDTSVNDPSIINEEKKKKGKTRPRLWKILLKAFWGHICLSGIFKLLWLIAVMITNVVLLVELLNIVNNVDSEPTTECCGGLLIPYRGFLFSCLFALGELFRSFFVHNFWQYGIWLGLDCRSSIIVLIFDKLLTLRGSNSQVGMALNMVQNDVERIRDACVYGSFLISTPIILVTVLLIGQYLIGESMFIGFIVLILSVPVQAFIGRKAGLLRRKAVKVTDERVTLMGEILEAIHLIKLYAWEEPFAEKLHKIRREEIVQLRHAAYLKSVNTAFAQSLPLLSCVATFGFHVFAMGKELTAQQAFSVLALFNVARFPLAVLPIAVRLTSESLVALKRIEDFLLQEELTPEELPSRLGFELDKPAIVAKSARFQRMSGLSVSNDVPPSESNNVYFDNLECKVGELTCIIGTVGSGKTSLLEGLLGEIRRVEGSVTIRGSIAYVSQRPWIFNGTVKENIIQNKAFDPKLFKKIISASALEPDLEILPAGVETELGERGINISGGQKTHADVYMFDDVLSAFDANVSRHIWENVFLGLLSTKTVVLATHALNLLPDSDNVIVMDRCTILTQGVFSHLMSSPFATHIQSVVSMATQKDDAENDEKSNESSEQIKSEDVKVKVEKTQTSGKLLIDEEKEIGAVKKATLLMYIHQSGGWIICLGVFSMFWLAEGVKTGSDVLLSFWVNETGRDQFYFLVYLTLILSGVVLLSVRGILFARITLKAAKRIHDTAFLAVVKATTSFFHVTPQGRIMNRFSGDIDKIDVLLVEIADQTLTFLVRCIFSVIVIAVVLPWFLLAIIPLGLFYSRMLTYCRKVLRQAKRLDSISRSPLVDQLQSTTQGLSTIRAFGILDVYISDNKRLVNDTTKSQLTYMFINRWIGFRLDMITTFIVTFCAFFVVVFASRLTSGLAGLVLTSALQTAGIFQYGTRQAAELEALFTCVERVRHFIQNTPPEEETINKGEEPKLDLSEWPKNGQVEFENYSVRYRSGLPLVLKEISFTIEGGSKAALVGRTGSGKSSTLLSLFRIMEAAAGRICIDGINIAEVPLTVLRSKALSVVPQSGVLFSGSIRYNLDPFGLYSDEDLWNALDRVQLKGKTKNNDVFVQLGVDETCGLDYIIEESGHNLSAGQRQLFCFARALLKSTKIICIDEGTSSVDEVSDAMIQRTLKQAFPDRTLMIIAHRLNTIRHVDQICVLDNGRLIETGSPDTLLEKEDGAFSMMWNNQNRKVS